VIPLWPCLPALERELCSTGRLVLLLDFDGTLAPIARRPEDVSLTPRVRALLNSLACCPGVTVAIVSGRALPDLRTRAAVKGLVYAGNHGLEISGGGICYAHPEALARREALARLCEHVEGELHPFAGARIENKGLTATVHYRLVAEQDRDRLRGAVQAASRSLGPGFVLRSGRCSLEIRPDVDWNKGNAAQYILERLSGPGAMTFCFGDDQTDEDAFAALPEAITVRVGAAEERTSAKYCLEDPMEVARTLERLFAVVSSAAVAEAS